MWPFGWLTLEPWLTISPPPRRFEAAPAEHRLRELSRQRAQPRASGRDRWEIEGENGAGIPSHPEPGRGAVEHLFGLCHVSLLLAPCDRSVDWRSSLDWPFFPPQVFLYDWQYRAVDHGEFAWATHWGAHFQVSSAGELRADGGAEHCVHHGGAVQRGDCGHPFSAVFRGLHLGTGSGWDEYWDYP